MNWPVIDSIARHLALPVAGGIFLNQLDELFVDANYLLRGLHRRDRRLVPWQDLERVDQKHIAILVPAWQEADVIRSMLEHNLASLHYDRTRYTIFCGTYANDPATQKEVDAAARRFSSVRKVVVPHDGPTSKADCLNWIYQGIVLDEQKRGRRYDILLMHDAEDVIHPLSLRLYSLLISRYDFIQTPVFSLDLALRSGVAATYIDEFAEHHQKDMLVREAIGGLVPSAGVGSAFARDAFEEIARAHGERPFNVESLTEDYEIGLKFRLANKRVHFACRSIERNQREEPIATREYFPGGFSASIRQRSRWILGITLQTWRQIGWKGSLPVLYCLWRDRKALFTNILLCLAYLLVAFGGARWGSAAIGWTPPIDRGADADASVAGVSGARLLDLLLTVNLVAMVWRASVKAKLVGRLHGWGHALLSAPRLVLGNIIGVAATARAVTMFVKHRLTGAPLRWLKTAHVFPTVEVLQAQRRHLGEILIEQRLINATDLDEALALQKELGQPLGKVVSLMGLASDRDVVRALGEIHGLFDAEPVLPAPSTETLTLLPEREAQRLEIVPLASPVGEPIRLAAAAPLEVDDLRTLEERLSAPVNVVLAPVEEIRHLRQRAYRQLLVGPAGTDAATPQPLSPTDVDWLAVAVLGRGFCALYALLPLRRPDAAAPGRTVIAAAYPVHPDVAAQVSERLGTQLSIFAASPLDVDVALAAGPSDRHTPGAWSAGNPAAKTLALLETLDRDDGRDPLTVGQARAAILDLPVAAATTSPFEFPLLPPELTQAGRISVRAVGERALVLASPRPSPRLARAVATLYPGWAIAWQVALPPSEPARGTAAVRPFAIDSFTTLDSHSLN